MPFFLKYNWYILGPGLISIFAKNIPKFQKSISVTHLSVLHTYSYKMWCMVNFCSIRIQVIKVFPRCQIAKIAKYTRHLHFNAVALSPRV